jgi:sorbitol/mannitol transport system substrate-binding protein
MLSNKRALTVGVFALSSALVLSACSSDDADDSGDSAGGNVTLNLATVNNGQMKDMEQLKTEYEKANPGTTVNFQVMEEADLRSAVTADVASGAGQYDIVTIGAYETRSGGANEVARRPHRKTSRRMPSTTSGHPPRFAT